MSWTLGYALSGWAAEGRAVAVGVGPKNSWSNLTLGDLRKILSGEKRTWPDGSRVKLFSRSPGTLERTALLKILSKSESEYKQYWTGKVYQGDAEAAPMVLPFQRQAAGSADSPSGSHRAGRGY